MSQKAIKESALIEHLDYHPIIDYQPLLHKFPNKHIIAVAETKSELNRWKMWFDGASNLLGNKIGLGFDYTNNMVEYEACAMGIMMALEHQVRELKLRGEWEMQVNEGQEMIIHIQYQSRVAHYQHLDQDEPEDLRRLASRFFLSGTILYKRRANMMLLLCVDDQEAKEIMEEVHEGTFGTYTNGHALARKILRVWYYWTKMESDCCQHVKRCMKCQIYVDNINVSNIPRAFFHVGLRHNHNRAEGIQYLLLPLFLSSSSFCAYTIP
ncbi:hypothetical protein CR513_40934, partial [Mucuna pruriens]